MLGSFKSLGGTYAGLRALARAAGTDLPGLLTTRRPNLPTLICASDGNHGLAVAAAARVAVAPALIHLHSGVPVARARRIADFGAGIVWVPGTYDDAVDAAAAAALTQGGILVADTSNDPADPVVADVLAGYGVIADEIRGQAAAAQYLPPTHIVIQAGVGGLAAAMAEGLHDWMAPPAAVIAVEPAAAACLTAALAAGRPVRVAGALHSSAEMLSCGEASSPALAILQRHRAQAVTVSEDQLAAAPRLLQDADGPATTESGAAGLAGLAAIASDPVKAAQTGLGAQSRVLIIISEAAIAE